VKRYALAVALLAACVIGLLLYHQPARVIAAAEAAKQKWEYKSATALEDKDLNRLGDEGWELVAVTVDKGGGYYYFFKRAK